MERNNVQQKSPFNSGIRSSPGLLFKTSSRGLEKSLLGLCSQSPRRNEKAFSPNFRRMDRRRLHRAKNAQSSYLRQLVSCISTEQDPLVPLLQNSEQIPRSFQLQNGNPTGVEKVHREGLLDDLDRYQERVPTSQDSSKRSKQTCFHSIGKGLEVQDDAFWSEYSSVHLDSPIQPSSESRKKGRDKDVLLHGRMYHLRSHTSGMRQSYRQILKTARILGSTRQLRKIHYRSNARADLPRYGSEHLKESYPRQQRRFFRLAHPAQQDYWPPHRKVGCSFSSDADRDQKKKIIPNRD